MRRGSGSNSVLHQNWLEAHFAMKILIFNAIFFLVLGIVFLIAVMLIGSEIDSDNVLREPILLMELTVLSFIAAVFWAFLAVATRLVRYVRGSHH
ncbi:DUF3955 domain-containing protein [Nitratireductor basaltis]|uniref:DUF3955 domain-containing protein n=1 Tax=Nitratireductor basaltis TaxID=472175 RepID=A0A084U918_9HYPH|nr:DUF3955 domain-containing protein [Nitratireductor basaltis]KFB09454.1 hypothetical protein EL18_00470 [Nitratireductor basaltis]